MDAKEGESKERKGWGEEGKDEGMRGKNRGREEMEEQRKGREGGTEKGEVRDLLAVCRTGGVAFRRVEVTATVEAAGETEIKKQIDDDYLYRCESVKYDRITLKKIEREKKTLSTFL